jgi:amino acid transporter
MASTTSESQRLGGSGRKLGLVDVVAQSVGFMGPVFSIAFLVPLVVGIISATGKGAGNAAPLAVLIAAIGILAVAWVVSEYAKRIQAAGALYDYVTDGLGQKLGAMSGFVYTSACWPWVAACWC